MLPVLLGLQFVRESLYLVYLPQFGFLDYFKILLVDLMLEVETAAFLHDLEVFDIGPPDADYV